MIGFRLLSVLLAAAIVGGCALVRDVVPEATPSSSMAPAQAPAEPAEVEAETAAAAAPRGDGRIGETVASLGDPGADGLWLRTGLVQSVQQGRVVDADSGAEVTLELRPVPASQAGSGGRLSMDGFAALGRGVTELPRLEVFAGG